MLTVFIFQCSFFVFRIHKLFYVAILHLLFINYGWRIEKNLLNLIKLLVNGLRDLYAESLKIC
jgi:hypothetical protein